MTPWWTARPWKPARCGCGALTIAASLAQRKTKDGSAKRPSARRWWKLSRGSVTVVPSLNPIAWSSLGPAAPWTTTRSSGSSRKLAGKRAFEKLAGTASGDTLRRPPRAGCFARRARVPEYLLSDRHFSVYGPGGDGCRDGHHRRLADARHAARSRPEDLL